MRKRTYYKIKTKDGYFPDFTGMNDLIFDTQYDAEDFVNKNYNLEDFMNGYEIEEFSSDLKEGTSSVYLDMLADYHKALNKAEKLGNVVFTVDLDGEDEAEFDTWRSAVKYAKENGFDRVHVSGFGFEGPYGYDTGDYEEYDAQFLDLNKEPINESLTEDIKEIQVRDNENIEKDAEECPLPLEVIPNEMGINLSNVEKVKWEEQEDGQLKKVEIDFNPGDDLEEDYVSGIGTINTVKECEDKIQELVKKRNNTKDVWWKKELLKDINKLVKLKTKLIANENGQFVTTSKLYSDLYKLAGLEKIQTRTTAIRGYRPITSGSIEIQNDNDGFYNIYFYKNTSKIPEIIEGLKSLGYTVKNYTDSSITVLNYNSNTETELIEDLEEDIEIRPGSTTIVQKYKEFDSKQEAVNFIISEEGYGEMNIRYIPKTKKYRVVWEEIDENINEDIEKHDELIYKVAEKLKNNISSFEDELITLSQIEGVDVEEIKQREPMQIAKALVEEGIVDFRMFEDIEKHYKITIGKDDDKYQDSYVVKAEDEEEAWQIAKEHATRKGFKDYDVVEYKTEEVNEDIEKHDTLKITNVNVYPKSTYETSKNPILVSATINGTNMVFVFEACFGQYVKDGIDCNEANLTTMDKYGNYDWQSSRVKISDGGGYRTYALNIPRDIIQSAPKSNQKDFRFTGQYYFTKPIKDYFIKALQELYAKGNLTTKFLNAVNVTTQTEENLGEDIEKHDTLNQKLFDGEELKPEIKDKIEQIAYQFVRELNEDGIRFTLKDIVLLGSNVSYNYTKDSDLDIHLIADSSGLECPDDLYPLLYSAYRSMFNKNYDIRIKGIPSEVYVEMDEPQAKSNGIYSLNNGWLKKPEQKDIPDLDEESFDKLFTEWEDKYFKLIGEEKLLTEAAQGDKRYYIKPLNIFCSSKNDILNALVKTDKDCIVYTCKNIEDNSRAFTLGTRDIIYYYEDGILYDKNHVKVMDYDLVIKNEENRKKFDVNQAPEQFFDQVYQDRITEDQELNEELDWDDTQDFTSDLYHSIVGVYSNYVDKGVELKDLEYSLSSCLDHFEDDDLYDLTTTVTITDDLDTDRPTSEEVENFIEDLYDLRKQSIANEGEYGLGNLVFKEFRNLGYLDHLKDLRKECMSKELSLEKLK